MTPFYIANIIRYWDINGKYAFLYVKAYCYNFPRCISLDANFIFITLMDTANQGLGGKDSP